MTKESNLFITFLKSFGSYIVFALMVGIGTDILGRNTILKSCAELISGIIFLVCAYSIYRKKIKTDIKNFKEDFKKYGKNILLISTILIVAEILINILLTSFGIKSGNQSLAISELSRSNIPMILYYIIVGTIAEETCFRLPYAYCKSNKLVKYIFYSVIFASIHIFASSSLIELLYIIPYLSLSFGIGYGFYKTDNILMSTMVHIINNSIAIMLILI